MTDDISFELLEDAPEAPAAGPPGSQGAIIRQFLLWARTAPVDHRVDAVGALAHALVNGDLPPEDKDEAELALLAVLDDPAPPVRHAIAMALASSAEAPRAIVAALLQDQGDVAAPVLELSPVLTDCELVDHVALCDAQGQSAVARRRAISPGLAGALAEVGALPAVLALLANPGARIADGSLRRIVERFGHEPAIRDVLLVRRDLPVEVRLTLAAALTRSLNGLAARAGGAEAERLEQRTRDACERAIVAMACEVGPDLVRRMVAHLRGTGQLTPSLILRAALSRAASFVEAALAELAGIAQPRAAAILRQSGAARDALYRKAGLPESLRPALLAAVTALQRDPVGAARGRLSRGLLAEARRRQSAASNPIVTGLLDRFAAEAARDEARRLARAVADQADALELTTNDLLREAPLLPPPARADDEPAEPREAEAAAA